MAESGNVADPAMSRKCAWKLRGYAHTEPHDLPQSFLCIFSDVTQSHHSTSSFYDDFRAHFRDISETFPDRPHVWIRPHFWTPGGHGFKCVQCYLNSSQRRGTKEIIEQRMNRGGTEMKQDVFVKPPRKRKKKTEFPRSNL